MKDIKHAYHSERSPLQVQAVDEPSHGGAHHEYVISHPDARGELAKIRFQKGTIPDAGVNGVTNEALIAIVIDRLEGFQAGKHACAENSAAAQFLRDGLGWLHVRTMSRMHRGIEGKELTEAEGLAAAAAIEAKKEEKA